MACQILVLSMSTHTRSQIDLLLKPLFKISIFQAHAILMENIWRSRKNKCSWKTFKNWSKMGQIINWINYPKIWQLLKKYLMIQSPMMDRLTNTQHSRLRWQINGQEINSQMIWQRWKWPLVWAQRLPPREITNPD